MPVFYFYLNLQLNTLLLTWVTGQTSGLWAGQWTTVNEAMLFLIQWFSKWGPCTSGAAPGGARGAS